MNWKKLSPYAIACDNFTISKQLVCGTPRYTLWEGDEMVAIFESARQAQEWAKAMAEKEVESVVS